MKIVLFASFLHLGKPTIVSSDPHKGAVLKLIKFASFSAFRWSQAQERSTTVHLRLDGFLGKQGNYFKAGGDSALCGSFFEKYIVYLLKA